jgi:hypothetical protein
MGYQPSYSSIAQEALATQYQQHVHEFCTGKLDVFKKEKEK